MNIYTTMGWKFKNKDKLIYYDKKRKTTQIRRQKEKNKNKRIKK